MLRNLHFSLLAFFVISFSIGAVAQEDTSFEKMLDTIYSGTVPVIQPQLLFSELDKNRDFVVLDSREKREYQVSHLKNARWVGYKDFDLGRVRDIPKNARIVVYCSVGYRSERIGEKLLHAGYQDVENLYGGIFNWVNGGYPVFDQSAQTDRVHAYSPVWSIWLKKGTKVFD